MLHENYLFFFFIPEFEGQRSPFFQLDTLTVEPLSLGNHDLWQPKQLENSLTNE